MYMLLYSCCLIDSVCYELDNSHRPPLVGHMNRLRFRAGKSLVRAARTEKWLELANQVYLTPSPQSFYCSMVPLFPIKAPSEVLQGPAGGKFQKNSQSSVNDEPSHQKICVWSEPFTKGVRNFPGNS